MVAAQHARRKLEASELRLLQGHSEQLQKFDVCNMHLEFVGNRLNYTNTILFDQCMLREL